MKDFIRKVLNRYGYDIIKTGDYYKIHPPKNIDEISLYHTATGKYYLPKNAQSDIVANAIKNNQVFEKDVIDAAAPYIKPGTVVLDVGANYGQMAVIFSEKVGPNGLVYAFDAQKFVFGILEKNIEANNRKNIKAVYKAVFNKDNETFFFPKADLKKFGNLGSYGIDLTATTGEEVHSITIDSLNIEQPVSFMKVDIQGSDLYALQGAVNTIRKHKMPIIFEFEQPLQTEFKTSFQDYVDFVNQIGYKFEKTILDINYLIVPK